MAGMAPSLVIVTRGGAPESVHRVAACLTTPGGVVEAETEPGAAARQVFARSAAKPLQALTAVEGGALEALGLGEPHLAVACASHSGGDQPVALATEILEAAGLDQSALRCGVVAPLDPEVAARIGADLRPIHHNCSGKHAMGLALCVSRGWPTEGYLEPHHPLQRAMRQTIAAITGERPLEGVDGCGMRAYRLPLMRLAAAFGRLAAGDLGPGAQRVADAMRAHPQLIGRPRAVDAELMGAERGLVAKLGAEGVVAVGLPDGRGLALKVLDGGWRALGPATLAAARKGLRIAAEGPGLERLVSPTLRNASGTEVGRVEARLSFQAPPA